MDDQPASVARGFLFADLRNYSAWVESHGDHAAVGLLREYRGLVRQAVAEFAGAEIKTEGDSFYVVFGSPSAAVNCGLRILVGAAESQAAAGGPIPVGIGVHAGETVATEEGYVGSAVNVAARVCAQARAGELLVTDAVRALTRTYLDVTFVPRGRRRLKGISEPIGLYRVMPPGHVVVTSRWPRVVGRWPIAAAALAIPLLIVAIALIGGALVRESAGGPGSSASPAMGTTTAAVSASSAPSPSGDAAFPSAAETRLLELLAAGDRDRCQRADPGDSPVLGVERIPGEPTVVHRAPSAGSIECDLGGISAPDRLSLWELTAPVPVPNPDPAGIAIAAHGGLVGASPGTCREGRPAIETWTFGDISGTLVCYESETGDAVLLWAYDDSRLFARALRDDRDMTALLDWWEDVGRFLAP
ncbi:MAG: adenylate/guanylate cyclase domain-containing protein [Chloroflexi bacterium]|nr:adenylate/guanylate cyclase domain-containing protein [Chloroflexota bacterium]